MNKDMATCAPGGKAPLQETLLVDSGTGGIKNVAIYLREASRVHDSAKPAADSGAVRSKGVRVPDACVCVKVGQTLDIKNSDDVGHNTNIAGKKNTFQPDDPGRRDDCRTRCKRKRPRRRRFDCSIHPWMLSYLLPRENGYFAVTKEDGSFEIANLPAGEKLDIQVWHESATGPGGA